MSVLTYSESAVRCLFAVLACFAAAVANAAPIAEADPDFVDDRWSLAVTLDHPKQRYFYFPPRTDFGLQKSGYALVVVLPGGRGDASSRPIYGALYLESMPVDFVMAQLVSVRWEPEQRIVWPTSRIKDVEPEFTSSEFIAAVIEDVRARVQVDPDRTYLMGASSSGGAVYTAALSNADVSGAVVTASVFREQHLPPLSGAAGKRFFLLQSPSDEITPFHYAQAAAEALSTNGGTVLLYALPGGHHPVWPTNLKGVYGYAFHWLQTQPNREIQQSLEPSPLAFPQSVRRFKRR